MRAFIGNFNCAPLPVIQHNLSVTCVLLLVERKGSSFLCTFAWTNKCVVFGLVTKKKKKKWTKIDLCPRS